MIRTLGASCILLLAACGGSGTDATTTPAASADPCATSADPCATSADPCATSADPCAAANPSFAGYEGWSRVTHGRQFSKGHGKSWAVVFVESGQQQLFRSGGRWPVGARLVKAQYSAEQGGELIRTTTMQKMPTGYDPDNGDWFYGVYDASGATAMKAGKLEMCINCHDQVSDRDYVFGPPTK